MKYLVLSLAILASVTCCKSQTSSSQPYPETKLGWKLSSVSYNWKMFTFIESLDKLDSCGLKYIEGWAGHVIGEGMEGKLDYHMDKATREIILQKLKSKNIKMLTYGVVTPKSESDWRQLFEFGKAMGIELFDSEPEEKFLPLISKLCEEYQIDVAIHNHTNPSPYWNPDILLNTIKGQSKRIGSCADIAHWVESGLDPIECLKKLKGRILHTHMADLNEKNSPKAQSVPWGTGVLNMVGIFEELKRQNYKGFIDIEYENNWYNNVPDIIVSIAYFRDLVPHILSKN